jgi:spore coat protein JB
MMNTNFNTSREALMLQVSQTGFAMIDANLYLDTHPCDTNAIAYFNQMKEAHEKAKDAFESQFGPLMASGNMDTAYWSWVRDPWPWEGGNC